MVNVPTDLVRTFVLLTESRSFTRTAKSLKVTQPAVSSQVKKLQQLLGFRLLSRSAPGFQLSSEGVRFLPLARQMLAANDDLLSAATNSGQLSDVWSG